MKRDPGVEPDGGRGGAGGGDKTGGKPPLPLPPPCRKRKTDNKNNEANDAVVQRKRLLHSFRSVFAPSPVSSKKSQKGPFRTSPHRLREADEEGPFSHSSFSPPLAKNANILLKKRKRALFKLILFSVPENSPPSKSIALASDRGPRRLVLVYSRKKGDQRVTMPPISVRVPCTEQNGRKAAV